MSAGDWSGLVTAVLLLAFLGGIASVWRAARRQEFEEAARLPLQDDEPVQGNVRP
jgi:cytochrome c oxidase cbb3-type subunit IV